MCAELPSETETITVRLVRLILIRGCYSVNAATAITHNSENSNLAATNIYPNFHKR